MNRFKVSSSYMLLLIGLFVWLAFLAYSGLEDDSGLTYSDFRRAVSEGRVERVVVSPALITREELHMTGSDAE